MTSGKTYYAPLSPEEFTGREDSVKQVEQRIADPSIFSASVVGGPRMGKTSFLRFIASKPGTHFRVYIDADVLGIKASPNDCWTALLRTLAPLASEIGPPYAKAINKAMTSPGESGLMYDLEDVFDRLAHLEKPVVCLVDNWESLLRNESFWPPASNFLHLIRYFGQRSFGWVLASQRSLLDLYDSTRNASPYYNIFETVYLGPLSEEAVTATVRKTLPGSEVSIGAQIFAASKGHPYLMRYVISLCEEQIAEKGRVDWILIKEKLNDSNGPVNALAVQIRSALSPSERQLVDKARTGSGLTLGEQTKLQSLKRYGLLPPGVHT